MHHQGVRDRERKFKYSCFTFLFIHYLKLSINFTHSFLFLQSIGIKASPKFQTKNAVDVLKSYDNSNNRNKYSSS